MDLTIVGRFWRSALRNVKRNRWKKPSIALGQSVLAHLSDTENTYRGIRLL